MIRLATPLDAFTAPPPAEGLRARIIHHLRAIRAGFAVKAEGQRGTMAPADTFTGVPTYQPDLPFFLQPGFGRRET